MSYLGPKLWNILPTEVKLSKSTNLFIRIRQPWSTDLVPMELVLR